MNTFFLRLILIQYGIYHCLKCILSISQMFLITKFLIFIILSKRIQKLFTIIISQDSSIKKYGIFFSIQTY